MLEKAWDSIGVVMNNLAIVVLAAGMGTRMKAALPKVLHKVAGRSMLGHALTAGKGLAPSIAVVIHGPGMENVQKESLRYLPACKFAEQKDRRGTGHAVSMAQDALKGFSGVVLVLYGDVPLIQTSTLQQLLTKIDAKHKMAVLGFEAANPHGYGRLITKGDSVLAIREELDTSLKEKKIKLCNSGIIAIDAAMLWGLVPKLSSKNAKNELYLTDLVELAVKAKTKVALAVCDEAEVAGVNDRIQLSAMEAKLQKRYRNAAMVGGATLIDPASVFFSADTMLGQDILIEPNVVFGPGVTVGDGVEILAFSHIEGAAIGAGARIGPYARLRPGAEIGADAHIGNFVEVKKAKIGKGAKANHLSYIGDAVIGAGSNIGAGTITCNYDGYEKHLTEIGEKVFVGSNTSLVAPVKIGDGVNIAAGSVITANIPVDALAITRAELQIKEGWAKRYRTVKAARKAEKSKA
jgi:bifunctional UDP-N-acetylglucosamine pyrophosphorylase / glucosamine-1-phosphate N-acetyltransferase